MPARHPSNQFVKKLQSLPSLALNNPNLSRRMSPRSELLSFVKWIGIACILVLQVCPSLQASIVAPGAPRKTLCDARAFRLAIVKYCTFQRRDIHPEPASPSRYFYNVNENESGTVLSDGAPQGEREEYGKLVFTQLGKETLFFPVEVFSAKVKRHREYNLHQKCCLTGCNPVDFTVVC